VIYLHPVVTLLTVYYFNVGFLDPAVYLKVLAAWLLLMPVFIYGSKDVFGKCTVVGKSGHLEWPDQPFRITDILMNLIYMAVLGIGIVTLRTPWYGILYGIVAFLSYLVSRSTYGRSWNTLWCHFINLLAVAALFL